VSFREPATVIRVGSDGTITRHEIKSYAEAARLVTDGAIDLIAGDKDRTWYMIVDDIGLVTDPPLPINLGASVLVSGIIAGPVVIVGAEMDDGPGYEPLPSFFFSADFTELIGQAQASPEFRHEIEHRRARMSLDPVIISLGDRVATAPGVEGLR
jgi:hypothetical protein